MKKFFIFTLAAAALSLTACKNKLEEPAVSLPEIETDDSGKDRIMFSMSDGSKSGADITRAGFTAATRIVMRIQSDAPAETTRYTRTVAGAGVQHTATGGFVYSDVTFSTENGYVRYWDDAYGRNAKLSVYAVAIADQSSETLLPISIMKDGAGTASATNVKDWGSSADNDIAFSVETTAQTTTTIAEQDLVYSNNIQENATLGKRGRYVYDFSNSKYIPDLNYAVTGANDFTDGQMQFKLNGTDPSNSGKFDKGHLNFNHALSRLTVQIIEGSGFDSGSSSDFQWKTGTNIVLAAGTMSTAGTLNVKTGAWTSTAKAGVAKFAFLGTTLTDGVFSGDAADARGYYRVQILPDYTFTDGNTENVLSFTIDDNIYYVDQNMIFDALTASGATLDGQTDPIVMGQGKNYMLKITVNKTAIAAMTATVEDWKDVVAVNQNLYNSYVTLNLRTTTGTACNNFDLYRLDDPSANPLTDKTTPTADNFFAYNWNGDYTDKATLTHLGAGIWKTNWYWVSNKAFYHFRTVNTGTTINTTGTKDNFTITSGAVASTDFHWGAPMAAGADLKYEKEETTYTRDGQTCTTEGFSKSIYKAIGSTTGTVAITELHMMSEIYVTIQTPDNDSKVVLYDGTKPEADRATKVTLTRFSKTGTVDMGTGFVRPSTEDANIGDQLMTTPSTFYKTTGLVSNYFSWSVVPQPLSRGEDDDDYIGITIQTPDANQYYIVKSLKDITASSVTKHGSSTEITDPNQAKDAKITDWYPGHHYYYTFTISKKGIEAITCTVADWIDITAANKDITLED